MKKKIIYITSLMLSLIILLLNTINTHISFADNLSEQEKYISCNSTINAQEISSSARAMFLFDAKSGREIYQKDCNKKLALASTTKIITAITALENFTGDLDKKHIVPSEAVGLEGTSMYIKYGEELSVRELLYGLMLPSGNDAGKALALLTSQTEKNFCTLMNKTAQKAGSKNSNFTNSHGLDAEGHYTTAKDLALITAYALKNDTFREIVSTKNVVIEETNKYQTRYFKNKNKLLFDFEGCIGVKTGFTDNAGRCLVTAVEDNNRQFICVVLNCPDMFEESSKLLNMAKDNYQYYKIIDKEKSIDNVKVINGKASSTNLYALDQFGTLLSSEEYDKINIRYNYKKEYNAPISPQNVLGTIEVFIDEHLIFSTNLCSIEYIKSLNTRDLINDIIENWS